MSRVLVIGAGAIGGLLGALLTEAGHDGRLLVRPQAAVALRHGIRIEGGAYGAPRAVDAPASVDVPRGWTPDLVLAATKTQDLRDALAQHARAIGDAAPVVALQNGLAQDEIVREHVGPARAVAAIVSLDAAHLEPGHVACHRKGILTIGAPFSEGAAAADRAAEILKDAVEVQRTAAPREARWTKLLVNLANVVPAITGLSFQDVARHDALATAVVRMAKEGFAVARAHRVKPAPIPWTSPALLRALALLPDPLARAAYQRRVAKVLGDAPAYGSTWQSAQRGRPLETEWLNGEIVRLGRARGVATPVNARAVALAEKGARLDADDAARALLA